ncbi:MAG: hypothetical protein R6W72_11320 [Desulfurivibrionaceae bacterium]
MLLETVALNTAIKLATPTAKKIYTSKLEPKLEGKIDKYFKNKTAISTFKRESVKYLAKLTGQCSIMNTIAFQNSPKSLEDLYIPLTIFSGENNDELIVDDKSNIFSDQDHILINDNAGMGKSTISKRIILNIINQRDYVPVFIELRQLENQPILTKICECFGITSDSSIEIIKHLPLLYVFDGMDEVANDIKKDIINYLKEFIEQIGESKILITSRKETYLSEFYSFKQYSIKPLSEKEAYSLLTKYDPDGGISNKLISGLKRNKRDDKGIKEFLATPLYVSLLFCSYRHKTVIPRKRHLFYSQVYEALFESHDLSKEVGYIRPKYSKLDSAEFHSVLRRLGFWCLKNNGKIEFQKDELEIIVSELLGKITGLNSNSPNFVKDLTTTVPIFVKESSTIRWAHKSLMEYFASMFICNDAKSQQSDVLLKLFNSVFWANYTNVLELCADIDYSTFRSSIMRQVMEDFLEYSTCYYKNISNRKINKNDIEARISLTYTNNRAFRLLEGFSTEEFGNQKLVEELIDHYQAKCSNLSEYIIPLKPKGLLHVVTGSNRQILAINIAADRSPELLLDLSYNHNPINLRDLSLKFNKLYFIDDDPKLPINNSVNFKKVNEIMSFGAKGFDIKAVRKELNHINEDTSNGIDSLIDGI